ncbi:MAG: right-handed parallel beta-helix repeat-containing protein [Rikenellaceae bacterium]
MKQKTNIAATLLSALLLGSCISSSGSLTIEIDTSVADDATVAVLAAIEKIEAGEANAISFAEGIYNFYPDKAIEKYCHTSNHGDYLSRVAFYLEGVQGVTIDGNGSDFVFHNRIYPFFITRSSDVQLKNFSINYAHRFGSEPVVVARDEKNHTFDIELPEGEQYEIRNGTLYILKPDYEFTIGQSILYDPATQSVAYNTEAYTPITGFGKIKNGASFDFKYTMDSNDEYQKIRGRQYVTTATQIKPGVIRIAGHKKALPPVGLILSCKGEQGINRLAPAIKFEHTKGFTAEGVTIYHASGMGILGENSDDILLDECRVIPAKGYLVSATADATHFVGCRGYLKIKDCTFRNQLDDACNIHGAYQPIVDILSDNSIGVRMGHFQQQGFILAREGDTLGFVRLEDSFHAYECLTVKDVKYINGRYNIVTFNEQLPADLQVGDLVENLSAYPSVEITGCYIGGNRARGILISNPNGTYIANNTFSTEMEAILMPVESGHWYESGNAIDVVIENNHFEDSNFSGLNRGIIRFCTDDDFCHSAFSNIVIRNNTFDQFDSWILEAANIDGLTFEGNTINSSDTYKALYPENPVCTFKYCSGVEMSDNTYNGNAKTMVKMLDDSEAIKFE